MAPSGLCFSLAEGFMQAAEHVYKDAGPWKVNLRWVLDSEKFNEWMNPVDYETEEAIAEQERLGLLIEGPSGAH